MSVSDEFANSAPAASSAGASIYGNPLLWMLMLIQALAYLDRQIINILAEPIKRDLLLSDAQLGMVTGLAFAIFYAVLGIPIARFSDRPSTDRVSLIATCLAIWSAMTAICGLAQSFLHMLLARIGVGIGEAGCAPPAHALISDSFSRADRPAALAFYGLGLPLGMLLGLSLGGMLAERVGWRLTLPIFGAPGLLLALIFLRSSTDPRKRAGGAGAGAASRPFLKVLREIGGSSAVLYLAAAITCSTFLVYGKGAWQAIFLIRSHHMSVGQAGLLLGLVVGIGLAIGTWLGGAAARRFGRANSKNILLAPAVGLLISMPFYLGAYFVEDWKLAGLLLFGATISSGVLYGPTYASLQTLVAPSSRAAAVALVLFVQNFIGLGLGPVLFGLGSDLLMPSAGMESVRWVLILTTLLTPVPAFFYWQASRRLGDGGSV